MMKQDKAEAGVGDVVDIWANIHSLFVRPASEHPEIDLSGFSNDGLRACLRYLLDEARDVNTTLLLPGTRERVWVTSPEGVYNHLPSGELVGVLWLKLPALPQLGFFIDAPDVMSISYTRGEHWSPVAVLALFDLLRYFYTIEPALRIRLDQHHFTEQQQQRFTEILREFFRELTA